MDDASRRSFSLLRQPHLGRNVDVLVGSEQLRDRRRSAGRANHRTRQSAFRSARRIGDQRERRSAASLFDGNKTCRPPIASRYSSARRPRRRGRPARHRSVGRRSERRLRLPTQGAVVVGLSYFGNLTDAEENNFSIAFSVQMHPPAHTAPPFWDPAHPPNAQCLAALSSS